MNINMCDLYVALGQAPSNSNVHVTLIPGIDLPISDFRPLTSNTTECEQKR